MSTSVLTDNNKWILSVYECVNYNGGGEWILSVYGGSVWTTGEQMDTGEASGYGGSVWTTGEANDTGEASVYGGSECYGGG